jgi:hypothetical protein
MDSVARTETTARTATITQSGIIVPRSSRALYRLTDRFSSPETMPEEEPEVKEVRRVEPPKDEEPPPPRRTFSPSPSFPDER